MARLKALCPVSDAADPLLAFTEVEPPRTVVPVERVALPTQMRAQPRLRRAMCISWCKSFAPILPQRPIRG
jgi:hypothetical protein